MPLILRFLGCGAGGSICKARGLTLDTGDFSVRNRGEGCSWAETERLRFRAIVECFPFGEAETERALQGAM